MRIKHATLTYVFCQMFLVKSNLNSMKNRFVILPFYCLLFACLFACNNSNTNNASVQSIVFDASEAQDSFDFGAITDTSYQIIALETSDDFLIGEIEKIEIKNNKIIIFDKISRAVFLFNMDGSPHSKIFKPGRGPGEYAEIFAMGANDSVIVIFDIGSRKLLEYDFNGIFIRESKLREDLWVNDIFFFNENLYLYAAWDEEEWGNSRLYLIDDIVNQNYKHYLPFDKKPLAIGNMGPSYSLCNNNASLIYSGCDTVFSILKDGTVSPSYVFDFKGKRAKYPSGRVELVFQENDDDRITNIQWISETDRYLHAYIGGVGNDYQVWYDKHTKTHQTYRIAKNSSLANNSYFETRLIVNNKIIMAQPMLNVFRAGTLPESEYKLKGFYCRLTKIINSSKIEDNPVVFIFNLKD